MAEDKILSKVDENRRGFLKKVLGASFAVPIIATFTVDALSVDIAQAINVVNVVNVSNAAGACLSKIGPLGCWPDA
jgi:hypothetical protein